MILFRFSAFIYTDRKYRLSPCRCPAYRK